MAWYSSAAISMWSRHDPRQTEEARAGGLTPGIPVIRGPRQRQHRASEEDRGADQGRRYGEGSSTHGVTSRSDERGADDGTVISRAAEPSGCRRRPYLEEMRSADVCRAPVVRFLVASPQAFARHVVRPRRQRGRPPRLSLRPERDGEGAQRAPDRIAGQLVPASDLLRVEDGEDAPHRRLAGVFEGLSRLHLADLAEEGLALDRADPLALRRA